jgi:hypothetical protein
MPHPTAFTPKIGATILGARLVGTPLRVCVRAAGVPWSTFCGWLTAGRAYNAADEGKRNAKHRELGDFAASIDKAGAQAEAVLYQRVLKATEKDGGLALKLLQWRADAPLRAARLDVERQRAQGTLVERVAIDDSAVTELREKLKRALGE